MWRKSTLEKLQISDTKYKSEFLGFSKFTLVGALATVTHLLMFAFLMETIRPSATLANLAAFCVAANVSFFGNIYWTFSHVRVEMAQMFSRYVALAVSGFVLNNLFAFIIVDTFQQAYIYAMIPMIFVTPLASYFGSKYWVFKAKT